MDENVLSTLQQIIAAHTGLHFRREDWGKLRQSLQDRMRRLKLRGPEEYLALLEGRGAAGGREWREFIDLITTGESYFFRDKEQFGLLRNRVLPELISGGDRRGSVRIWCAGCSTGEEPYSIAILLDQLLPGADLREVLILGTDINTEAIDRARRGRYGRWSFRMADPDLVRRYFSQEGDTRVLDERIRRMVTFRVCNLMADRFPDPLSDIREMDLIICRNVFIYFSREAVSQVLEKIVQTLREGGYLLTGHGELHDQELGPLRPELLPESVIYRKLTEQEARPVADSHRVHPEKKKPTTPRERPGRHHPPAAKPFRRVPPGLTPQGELEALFFKGDYAGVIELAESVIGAEPRNRAAYDLLARACANLGDYDKAATVCRKALDLDVTAIGPYLLLAHLAELRNDVEEARVLLKKAVYLEPAHVAPYLELACIYEREGDHGHARRLRATAVELLAALPTEAVVEPYGEPAGEMLENLKRIME